ncbi:MAG: PilN domain-containing protein [Neisseria sp.]|nr:PilN domain-containing protein [Neisseria sp.]
MIKLIGLNLLPYREIERQEKQKEFNRLMVLALLAGLVLAGVVWFMLNQTISNQNSRNELLQAGIADLDNQIKDVKDLERQKQEFLARKLKIEELQNERYKAAMIFNDLNTVMPDGVYLTKIESSDGLAYTLSGRALSDSRVAMLMRSLPSTGLFSTPELVGIKTNNGAQEFVLRTRLVQVLAEASPKQ